MREEAVIGHHQVVAVDQPPADVADRGHVPDRFGRQRQRALVDAACAAVPEARPVELAEDQPIVGELHLRLGARGPEGIGLIQDFSRGRIAHRACGKVVEQDADGRIHLQLHQRARVAGDLGAARPGRERAGFGSTARRKHDSQDGCPAETEAHGFFPLPIDSLRFLQKGSQSHPDPDGDARVGVLVRAARA